MKQKTKEIYGHYILDELTVEEITRAYRHHFEQWCITASPIGVNPPITLLLHFEDAAKLSKQLNGLKIILSNNYSFAELNIDIDYTLERGEILFSPHYH